MLKFAASAACALTLLLSLPATPACAEYGHGRKIDWSEVASKFRFVASAGWDSGGLVKVLTFRDAHAENGYNWQLTASYPGPQPVFGELGLMGWTLTRQGTKDAKTFGLVASAGARFGATQVGAGIIPRGARLFVRRFFGRRDEVRGPMAQFAIVFPAVSGSQSFADLSLGYGF